MASPNIHMEKGQTISTARPATSSLNAGDVRAQTPLELFQMLVGIHTPADLVDDKIEISRRDGTALLPKRSRQENVGLYQRAKDEERRMRLAYASTSFISHSLYMIQILLAATFTALSAYKDSHPVDLTVLGAINTVLAGCLAWQKGQGVPQRYRKARDQYQSLILEIEMAERSFIDGGAQVDPRAEQVRLQKLFETARADQQANYPDLYVSTGAHTVNEEPDVKKQIEDAKTEATKVQSELLGKIEALLEEMKKAGTKSEAVSIG